MLCKHKSNLASSFEWKHKYSGKKYANFKGEKMVQSCNKLVFPQNFYKCWLPFHLKSGITGWQLLQIIRQQRQQMAFALTYLERLHNVHPNTCISQATLVWIYMHIWKRLCPLPLHFDRLSKYYTLVGIWRFGPRSHPWFMLGNSPV